MKYAAASNKAAYSRQHSGIFFALLLRHAVGSTTEGIYLRTRSDGRLFNLARLKAKTEVREAFNRDMLFAHDAAIATHSQQELQSLMNHFSQACKDLMLTISQRKTNIMGQDTPSPPTITINNYELDSCHQFQTLDQQSPITSPCTLRSIRGLERQLQHSRRLKDGFVQWLCTMPAFLAPYTWQRDMDHICHTGKEAQHLPPKKHSPHLRHFLARQSDQRWSPVSYWLSHPVHPATFVAWKTAASLKISSMETLLRDEEALSARS